MPEPDESLRAAILRFLGTGLGLWTSTETVAAGVDRPLSEVAAALAALRREDLVDWRRRDASAWGPARTQWMLR